MAVPNQVVDLTVSSEDEERAPMRRETHTPVPISLLTPSPPRLAARTRKEPENTTTGNADVETDAASGARSRSGRPLSTVAKKTGFLTTNSNASVRRTRKSSALAASSPEVGFVSDRPIRVKESPRQTQLFSHSVLNDNEASERVATAGPWNSRSSITREISLPLRSSNTVSKRKRRKRKIFDNSPQIQGQDSLSEESGESDALGEQEPISSTKRPSQIRETSNVEAFQRNSSGGDGESEEEAETTLTEKLEVRLRSFQKRMGADHAELMKWILCDVIDAIEEQGTEIPFMDKEDPFAVLKPLEVPVTQGQEDEVVDGHVTVILERTTNQKKKSKVKILSKTINCDIPRVPKYRHHTTVKRNMLTGDEDQLKFMPYLDEMDGSAKKVASHMGLIDALESAYQTSRSKNSRVTERTTLINVYMDNWLKELNEEDINRSALETHFLYEDLHTKGSYFGLKSKQLMLIIRNSECPKLSVRQRVYCHAFADAFERVFTQEFPLREVLFPKARLEKMMELIKTPEQIDNSDGSNDEESVPNRKASERIGTFTGLACLICGSVSCQFHGDYFEQKVAGNEEGPEEYSYMHQPLAMDYRDNLRKQDMRISADRGSQPSDDSKPPCSKDCYRIDQHAAESYELEPLMVSNVMNMATNFREKKHNPACHIAFYLDLPCWQVYRELDGVQLRPGKGPSNGRVSSVHRQKPLDWYNNRTKTLGNEWENSTVSHRHEERGQVNACAHAGPCGEGCPCFHDGILCEDICGCPPSCTRRWTGCSCHSNGLACTTDSCVCVVMNRECGPQCTSCGALPRIDPANRLDDALFSTGCQNVSLQRGVSAQLLIGESGIENAGFGLYLAEPIKKGQFLTEYTGELISNNEGDRRGLIYDSRNFSFLFDLNNEWIIDAARLGNKSRFMNHARTEADGRNCTAKIVLVNGEHRIKFVGTRDLAVGEELLFNYGSDFEEKHGLSSRGKGAGFAKGKRGDRGGRAGRKTEGQDNRVGQKALEVFDDLTSGAISGGKLGGAGRGRGSGRGRGNGRGRGRGRGKGNWSRGADRRGGRNSKKGGLDMGEFIAEVTRAVEEAEDEDEESGDEEGAGEEEDEEEQQDESDAHEFSESEDGGIHSRKRKRKGKREVRPPARYRGSS